ncbi:MAG: hypothetical protein ABL930_05975 [Pseudobdellovibrio sp.]
MKKISYILYVLALATSCQNFSKSTNSQRNIASEEYQAQIKADKKRQAELDLPFRGFSEDKNLQVIAFSSGINSEPPEPLWTTIEKNNPELMLVCSTPTPLKSLSKTSEYRAIREKVPFMATWYNYNTSKKFETKADFIKNWPYAKNMITANQDGFYHSKFFGTKKNLIHIIMSDLSDTRSQEAQWAWLENELKQPAAIKVLACGPEQREKLLALIKKTKAKNLILIPNNQPVQNFEKTEIKDFGPIYEATANTADFSPVRSVSSAETPLNFGLIKINWNERVAQLEIRSVDNQKMQSLDLKF